MYFRVALLIDPYVSDVSAFIIFPSTAKITVVFPTEDAQLILDYTYTILWNTTGIDSVPYVNIQFAGNSLDTIQTNVPNLGWFKWTIPIYYGVLLNARIRVISTVDDAVVGTSSNFEINAKPTTCNLDITFPLNGNAGTCNVSITYNNTCTLQCNKGYVLATGSLVRECYENTTLLSPITAVCRAEGIIGAISYQVENLPVKVFLVIIGCLAILLIIVCVFYCRGKRRKVEHAEDHENVLPNRKMTSDTQEPEVVVTLPDQEQEIEMAGIGQNANLPTEVGASDEVEEETPAT